MIVRELLWKLGFKTDTRGARDADKALAGVDARAGRARVSMERLKRAGAAAGQALKKLSVVTVGLAVATGKLVTSYADMADGFAKDARRIGTTAEALQELGHAAELSGSNFGVVKTGMQALSRGLFDATTKGVGPAAEAFQALGISLDDPAIKSKDMTQILERVADEFSKMPDNAEKTALAMKLFSRSGAELIPLLNAGGAGIRDMREEFRGLGSLISNEAAAQAEAFNDNLLRLKTGFGALRNEVGARLLPILAGYVDEATNMFKANREVIATNITDFVKGFVRAVRSAFETVSRIVKVLRSLTEGFLSLEQAITLAGLAIGAFMLAGGGLPGLVAAVGLALGKAAADWAYFTASAKAASVATDMAIQKFRDAANEYRRLHDELNANVDQVEKNAEARRRAHQAGFGDAFLDSSDGSRTGVNELGFEVDAAITAAARDMYSKERGRLEAQIAKETSDPEERRRRLEAVRQARSNEVLAATPAARAAATKAYNETGSLEAAKKAAADQIRAIGRKSGGGGKAKAKGGAKPKGPSGSGEKDMSAEDLVSQAVLGPGFTGDATRPNLGTTIATYNFQPTTNIDVKVEPRPGESAPELAQGIWDKHVKPHIDARDRRMFEHFKGAPA